MDGVPESLIMALLSVLVIVSSSGVSGRQILFGPSLEAIHVVKKDVFEGHSDAQERLGLNFGLQLGSRKIHFGVGTDSVDKNGNATKTNDTNFTLNLGRPLESIGKKLKSWRAKLKSVDGEEIGEAVSDRNMGVNLYDRKTNSEMSYGGSLQTGGNSFMLSAIRTSILPLTLSKESYGKVENIFKSVQGIYKKTKEQFLNNLIPGIARVSAFSHVTAQHKYNHDVIITKIFLAAGFKNNILTAFNYVIWYANKVKMSEDLKTSMVVIYNGIKVGQICSLRLTTVLQKVYSVQLQQQYVILFQEMRNIAPVYIRPQVSLWLDNLTTNKINMNTILRPKDGTLKIDLLSGIPPPVISLLEQEKNIASASGHIDISINMSPIRMHLLEVMILVKNGDVPLTPTLIGSLLSTLPTADIKIKNDIEVIVQHILRGQLPHLSQILLGIKVISYTDACTIFEDVFKLLSKHQDTNQDMKLIIDSTILPLVGEKRPIVQKPITTIPEEKIIIVHHDDSPQQDTYVLPGNVQGFTGITTYVEEYVKISRKVTQVQQQYGNMAGNQSLQVINIPSIENVQTITIHPPNFGDNIPESIVPEITLPENPEINEQPLNTNVHPNLPQHIQSAQNQPAVESNQIQYIAQQNLAGVYENPQPDLVEQTAVIQNQPVIHQTPIEETKPLISFAGFPIPEPKTELEPVGTTTILSSLIPMPQPGTTTEDKLAPLRQFLSQPDVIQILGIAQPEAHGNRGSLLRVILKHIVSSQTFGTKIDWEVVNLAREYLGVLQNKQSEIKFTTVDLMDLAATLPQPTTHKEQQYRARLDSFLNELNASYLLLRFPYAQYSTKGAMMQGILQYLLALNEVKQDSQLLECISYYSTRVIMEGIGQSPIQWVLRVVMLYPKTIDLDEAWTALDCYRMDRSLRKSLRRVNYYLSQHGWKGLDNVDNVEHTTKGQFLRFLIGGVLSGDKVSGSLRTDFERLLPLVRLDGAGAESLEFV